MMSVEPFLRALAIVAMGVVTPLAAQELVPPSAANPGVQRFDSPNIVYAGGGEPRGAPLAVFLTGTGGTSENAPRLLLETIHRQGYRVIYLTYDDTPPGTELCVSEGGECYARFRASRSFGGAGDPIETPRAEAIVDRLGDLLRYLARGHPDQGWGAYLDASGKPMWSRVVLSGLSQGAGMAAFMAKRFPVRRVVLFSSPWDAFGPQEQPAPWLFEPSATPPDRWWAERHAKEVTTGLIANAYAALRIPRGHILIFDAEDVGDPFAKGVNRNHVRTVMLPQYVAQWRRMYGSPGR